MTVKVRGHSAEFNESQPKTYSQDSGPAQKGYSRSPLDSRNSLEDRTCRFFHSYSDDGYKDHLRALEMSDIGAWLANSAQKAGIRFERNKQLPDNTEGQYNLASGTRVPGKVEYGQHLNAMILGHELRHGWQHLKLPADCLNPQSPDEFILLDRFIEADGRAVEFGITLQIAEAMHFNHEYSWHLLASLDDYEKQICEYDTAKAQEIARSPEKLQQAMRRAFDLWISQTPYAPAAYDDQAQDRLQSASTSKLYKIFFRVARNGLSPKQAFTRTGIDPAYVDKLVHNLGYLGDQMRGNYLTATNGPSFTDRFYTLPNNYKLEREARKFDRHFQ